MKTILSAIFTVALVSVLVGAGTFAHFTDTEVSSGNTFTAGTMDLYLTNTILSPDAQWTFTQGAPGFNMASDDGDIRIHNLGSIEADHVEIAFSYVGHEDNNGDADDGCVFGPEPDTLDGIGSMARDIIVTQMSYFKEPADNSEPKIFLVTSNGEYYINGDYLTDTNENDVIDLEDLNKPINKLNGLYAPAAINAEDPDYIHFTQLDMEVYLVDTGVSQNEFQGDIIDMTVTVTLVQDENQT